MASLEEKESLYIYGKTSTKIEKNIAKVGGTIFLLKKISYLGRINTYFSAYDSKKQSKFIIVVDSIPIAIYADDDKKEILIDFHNELSEKIILQNEEKGRFYI